MFDVYSSELENRLRWTPVGLDLAELVESIDSGSLSERERIEMIVAQRRMASHFLAQSYLQIASHFDHNSIEPPSDLEAAAQQTEVEVGTALHLTRRSAHLEFELAYGLSQIPEVWEALDNGTIDVARARILIEALAVLDAGDASLVLDRVLGAAATLTTGQLSHLLGKVCVLVNPDAAKKRYEAALDDRRVEVGRSSEGTAELRGSDLDPARAEAVYGRLTHLAKRLHREGDPRTVDQLRADLLLDLLLGGQSGGGAEPTGSVDIRVDLEMLAELKEMPGDLAGYGRSLPTSPARSPTSSETAVGPGPSPTR